LRIAAAGDVIYRAGKFNSEWPGHGLARIGDKNRYIKT
jgi:hypothetical protein